MTPAEWDEKWWVIREDLVAQGAPVIWAAVTADRETTEQFGTRPEETTR